MITIKKYFLGIVVVLSIGLFLNTLTSKDLEKTVRIDTVKTNPIKKISIEKIDINYN